MVNLEPLLRITKPAEGLNKPCQGNASGRKSLAAEEFNVKIPFISQIYTKAVAISFRQSHTRTRNLVKYHPRVVFPESFRTMVSTDEEVCSLCEREFDRHCKVQVKRILLSDIQWLDSLPCQIVVFHFHIQNLDSFCQTFFLVKLHVSIPFLFLLGSF